MHCLRSIYSNLRVYGIQYRDGPIIKHLSVEYALAEVN